MIITPSLLTALMTSFKKEYQAGQTMAEPAWNKLASKVSSSSKSNTYGWLGQFPQFREWVGDRVIKDMAAQLGGLAASYLATVTTQSCPIVGCISVHWWNGRT